MIPNGMGYFIWKLKTCRPIAQIVQILNDTGADWITLKLLNGPWKYNQVNQYGDWVGNDDYLIDFISSIRAYVPGIKIGGWGWIYTREVVSMARQSAAAAERCQTLGMDFWLIDAEENQTYDSFWKSSTYRYISADEYVEGLEAANVPSPGLCSYRYPDYHRLFPWDNFLQHDYIGYSAPQVYWIGSHNPAYQLNKCIDQYNKRVIKPIVPIGAAFKEGGWTTTPGDLMEFNQEVKSLGLDGWGYWVLDQAKDYPEWLESITDDTTPIPPTPDPPPTPLRIEIVGLANGETLRLRNNVWGDVVGQTWNGCQFKVMGQAEDSLNRVWYQLGAEIWVAGWYCNPAIMGGDNGN
jgi:hypothetical protein